MEGEVPAGTDPEKIGMLMAGSTSAHAQEVS